MGHLDSSLFGDWSWICVHGGIVAYSLFPSLFQSPARTSITPRAYSCHYHYRQRQLHYLPRRHHSSRAYYQLRRKKGQKQTALLAYNRLIANFNGPWESTNLSLLQPPWEYPTTTSAAANELFGMPAAWYHELLTHEHHFVDLIKQIRSLKILSGGSFLATELHHKHIRWKSHTRRAMVAAAAFIHSRDLTDLTDQQQGDLPSSVTTALTQCMTVYLSDKGDDLVPIVIDSGASISLTANYNNFVGPICPVTITELRGLSHTTKVHGVGKVEWTVRDMFGAMRTIKTQAYYIPDATVRLFSPQATCG